ncbi:MAG: thioredoxin [Candidatus Omnitrophota bacterium]
MSKNIIEVTEPAFDSEVRNVKGVVLVDFWASWCAPCNMLAPVLERIADSLSGELKFCKLNVDDNPSIASEFGVMSIPTLIIFKDGKEQGRMTGFPGEGELTKKIKEYLAV